MARARRAFCWHEAADTALFHPLPTDDKDVDLIWVGNWGDDERTQELATFLLDPATRLGLRVRIHGVRYPSSVRDDLAVLMREAESAQKAYETAMGRMTQTKLESQTTQTNVLVINDAIEPTTPSSPKILLNTVLSIILGSMLAVGFALLREMSDRIVRAEVDLSQALGLPVLGVVNRQPRGLIRQKYPALT